MQRRTRTSSANLTVSPNPQLEKGVRLIPVRRANMRPHAWFMDDIELRAYRHTIETVNSQLEKMGIERTLSILMLMELQQTCEGGQRLADSIRFF